MSHVYDVVIIGAGIVGAACARAFAADGMDVAVVEAGVPAGGATAAGMGHVVVMDVTFHDAVLDSGALPLDVLEEKINRWIVSQGEIKQTMGGRILDETVHRSSSSK